MHSDPYRTYSEKLNAMAPYYPFGEMRNLVMNHNGRRKSAFAGFFRYAAGFGLLLLIGGIALVNNRPKNSAIAHPANLVSTADVPSALNVPNNVTESVVLKKEVVRNSIAGNELNGNNPAKNESLNLNQSKTDKTIATLENSSVDDSTEQKNAKVSQVASTLNAAPSVPASLIQTANPNEATKGLWSAFVSGGPVLSSNNFSVSSMLGAVGLQYRLFGSSSLVVELRHSGFTQNRAGQSGTSTDTTLTAGGYTGINTIGTPSTMATTSTVLVNSLDLGCRYVLNPNDAISPSAEILAGASTSGFISLEAVGIEYRFATSLTLDMSVRAEQLFSSSASPLGSLGLEATLGFQW